MKLKQKKLTFIIAKKGIYKCLKYTISDVIAVVYLKRWYAVERQSVGATVA